MRPDPLRSGKVGALFIQERQGGPPLFIYTVQKMALLCGIKNLHKSCVFLQLYICTVLIVYPLFIHTVLCICTVLDTCILT